MPRITRSRARVLLVNYAGYPTSPNSLMPDNGLASLAGTLHAAGHQVKILDYATPSLVKRLIPPFFQKGLASVLSTLEETAHSSSKLDKARQATAFLELKALAKGLAVKRRIEESKIAEEIASEVSETGATMVGFKLWNGDGFSGPLRMAGYLKKRFPNLLVAAGGPQVKFYKENIFSVTSSFDVLAVGDGEATILLLAEASLGRDLMEVPNIYFRSDGNPVFTGAKQVADMSALAYPLYDTEVYPAMEGDQKIKILVIEDRRGCENVCKFCVHPALSGARPRLKTAARIIDEFERAYQDQGIANFRLGGSSTPAELLHALAQEIEKRELDVNWTAFARIKGSNPDDYLYLRQNGLFSLFFGIESGNQAVLDAMGKNVLVEDIRRVIAASKAAEIFTVGSIIYPAPFDTQETRQDTFRLLEDLRPDSVPLQFMGVFPNTPYAMSPEKYNIEVIYPSLFSNLLARLGLKKPAQFNDPEVQRYLMEYKIQLLFPPKFWAPLPWKINGMGHTEFASETQSFYEDLKSAGILSFLTDEEALMAHLGGYAPKHFADSAFHDFFTGDWERMTEMVAKINGSK